MGAVPDHQLRHAGRRDHPRADQGVHLDRIGPREGGRHFVTRRRRFTERALRLGRGQLQRLLDGHRDHRADGRRLLLQHDGPGRADARAGRVRLRLGRVRLLGHGPGHDRGRLLRAGHGQRAVGVRALADHRDRRRGRRNRESSTASRSTSSAPKSCSRRTTAPATPSRPRPSPC